ncbi:type IV secretion system DNA-binding domain-containing protein [Novosphingopyxis sp.]|uniref:type IV secretion system DNA-binding domain-containing protein n=1 Tax=Novosphingopyxis sp. TaxID=2709690 RepID=UPI003B5C4F04
MKRNLVNFTRGSQLLGHFGFMFAAGLKGPVIIAAAVTAGLCWWGVRSALGDHQLYLVWMHIYARLYAFMEFDPSKLINLDMASGGHVQLPISAITGFPPMAQAVAAFWRALRHALLLSALTLTPSFILFYWFAERFGGRSKERKHERGAMLVSLAELEEEIARHNRAEQARELGSELGWKWRLAGSRALAQAGYYTPAHLSHVPYPWRLEQSHAMLIGTTGTGKTVALTDLLSEARSRGQRAVVFDLTGAFIEAFYDAERDVILNPLDARCPAWSVFEDCDSEAEFHAAAEALVPHDGGGSEQFWVLAARMLFVEMCLHLKRAGTASNDDLAKRLMTADLAQVHKLMRGTMADPLTAPEAARMAESIRAVFNANAKALKLLPSEGPAFSLRDWVQGRSAPGSVLFISARYVDMSICSQLLTLWMDTAMNTLMSMDRTRDLRLWFLIDEVGALHRLPALEKGLQTARNFGGAIVTGVHAFAKLKEVYGENMAMTLSSLARTKLILATADRETATWCSDFIGHRQVKDMEEGYSYGYNNARDAVSLTPCRQIEPLLLPDQFMNLPRLSGYIKFPDGFPAAPVLLTPRRWPRIAEGFIARAADDMTSQRTVCGDGSSRSASSRSVATEQQSEHPASNDDGAGKPVDLRQLDPKLTARDLEPETNGQVAVGTAQATSPVGLALEPTSLSDRNRRSGKHVEEVRPTPPVSRLRTSREDDSAEARDRQDSNERDLHAVHKTSDQLSARPGNAAQQSGLRPRQERDLLEGAVEPDEGRDIGEYDLDL